MAKILVLGGTGFVGKNICECLDENKLNYSIASRKTGVDLRNLDQAIKLFKAETPDFIINCAAHVGSLNYVTEQAADIIINNTKMTLSIYESANQICPKAIIINPIANCAYPGKLETLIENNIWNGQPHFSVFSYGSTRRMLLATAECFSAQYGLKSINLLVPNMYGPYDSTDPNKAHALNALISKFVKAQNTDEETINIWGTGIAIREWLYAKDFGRIIIEIIKNQNLKITEPINIAQNFGLSIKDLVEIIKKHLNYQDKISYDPSMPNGAPKKVMDDTKFKSIFKNFRFTDLDDGIKNTIAYYESIYPY